MIHLAEHDNKEAIFGHLVVGQCGLVLQHLTIVNQQLLPTRVVILSLYIFNVLLDSHNLR